MLAQALVPAAVGKAIDAGIIARDQRALLWWGGAVVALGTIQAAAGILRDRAALTTRLGAAYRTAQLIARQAARLGATLPKRVAKGEIVNAGVADIGRLGKRSPKPPGAAAPSSPSPSWRPSCCTPPGSWAWWCCSGCRSWWGRCRC
ncbi:hypothetical protein SANT12839_083150 [Streptomyces antimycoticus]|uniref:Uncharacterized protein n=1 Tax=Streptomyces antimycoticus TaxID=68175 RepID=A0A4D4KNH6_9ACTN|nr:hypothetical protein [Streptomyces antimycoticus]GDY47433.1 hypothetical protein SANT12839_083150 [Streptomyces antimycoticus]